ncbi:DoxX family membrane protein [Mixta sp. Marseille-Q2659]|uniref:DoxX family membrane protein n=1 Tax=Mixta sp. Marseille-Q2659 TaxID=2736607 RepID=UPI0023B92DA4|nr:DoxX family membrane protein [Mixta sp. Marseille-Q2659]
MSILELICRWFVIGIFTMGFVANTFGLPSVKEEFRQWKIPQWIRVLTGIAEGCVAIMLIFQVYPAIASFVASIIMAAALIIICYNGEMKKAPLPLLVLISSLITLYFSLP